jgi:hypothetical protein
MKKILTLGLLSTLVLFTFSTEAQLRRNNSRGTRGSWNDKFFNIWKFTAGAGIATYKGDLDPSTGLNSIRPQLYVGAQYRFTGRISARAEAGWYQIAGDDKNSKNKQRYLNFVSNNFEFNLGAMFDFVEYTRRYSRVERTRFYPYLFAGIGLTTLNPQTRYNGELYSLRGYMTEGKKYAPTALTYFPGIGVRYRLNGLIDLSLEGSYRFTSTDYLDDVSNKYAFNGDAVHDALAWGPNNPRPIQDFAPQFNIRGNPTDRDGYFLLTAKIEIKTVTDGNYGGPSGSRRKAVRRARFNRR